ncbi:uncharacterized protein LOC106463422 [Limulus polyphemus]|uniref:Uncharacterized protein LOC106463422 n=1 Tax=Limulus polyphemus TaxID=6850 RepID=A0ABM1SSL0_LIMPO|nr:uncharacterized protein LOC106463422 [Limulus polyphemus]
MACWNSLSGYLVHKPGGALGRLKSKKRQWYVYDEGSSNLLYYKNETDSNTKQPLGAINIRDSAISLTLEEINQFVIHSENKEYVLVADNHESMMIWIVGLQASRDGFHYRLALMNSESDGASGNSKNHQSQRRTESLPNDQEMKAMITRTQVAEDKTKIFRTHSFQLQNTSLDEKPQSEKSPASTLWMNKTTHSKNELKDFHHSKGTEKIPKFTKSKVTDVAHTYHEETEAPKEEARGTADLDRNNNDSRRGSLESESENVREFREDSGSNNYTVQSDSSGKTSDSETLDKVYKSQIGSSQPISDTRDRVQLLKKINADSIKLIELKRNSERTGSMSGTSVSSDSAMGSSECGHFVRLQDLETDLMLTKCELAKALNREASYKNTVMEKDALIRELQDHVHTLEREDGGQLPNQRSVPRYHEKCRILQNHNRFLNDEVLKLTRMLQEQKYHNQTQMFREHELEEQLNQLKRDYVFLLQSSIRFSFVEGSETMKVCQYAVKKHKTKVLSLLEEARKHNPALPAYDGISKFMTHVDSLGFKHICSNEGLILNYVCRQLHQYYTPLLGEYKQHEKHWIDYLHRHGNNLQNSKELKNLVRGGIPSHLRGRVWRALYRQKLKDVMDSKGSHYFNNLSSMASESGVISENRRQIGLDLLRTIPSNVRFCEANADGVRKMQQVLQAFCLHNPSLGYCQGMNFLVGMCLLFLEPEDAFYCLVAITEKYFTPNYFDQNLIGAQADQQVLKDLLREKLPNLYRHLASNDIELSTITLNWFLAIFFDAVPFEVLLRIWDCFLLEGPKILFRFTLAILKMQEDVILTCSDTVSIMRQLKAAAKFCFDIETLIKTAFEELEPFPRRHDIATRQACYGRTLSEKSKKREIEKQAQKRRELMLSYLEEESGRPLIECASVYDKGVYCIAAHQMYSNILGVYCIAAHQMYSNILGVYCIAAHQMYSNILGFESRVMCLYTLDDDTMLLGSLYHFVHAYSTKTHKLIWEIRLNDSVLSLCSHEEEGMKKVYAGLADGTLAVIEGIQGFSPQPECFYIMIGSSPVTCLQHVQIRLWCACGNRVIILNSRTLDTVDQFQISTNLLDYISMLVLGEHGVWMAIKGSSVLQLWDPTSLVCRLLYDVRENMYPKSPKKEEKNGLKAARITSLLPLEGSLLVGTGEGTLIIFDVSNRLSRSTSAANSPFPEQASPSCATSEQIQDRIQEVLAEQKRNEHGAEDKNATITRKKDSSRYTVNIPTPAVLLNCYQSTIPSEIAASSEEQNSDVKVKSPGYEGSSTSTSSGQLSTETVVPVTFVEFINKKGDKRGILQVNEGFNKIENDDLENATLSVGPTSILQNICYQKTPMKDFAIQSVNGSSVSTVPCVERNVTYINKQNGLLDRENDLKKSEQRIVNQSMSDDYIQNSLKNECYYNTKTFTLDECIVENRNLPDEEINFHRTACDGRFFCAPATQDFTPHNVENFEQSYPKLSNSHEAKEPHKRDLHSINGQLSHVQSKETTLIERSRRIHRDSSSWLADNGFIKKNKLHDISVNPVFLFEAPCNTGILESGLSSVKNSVFGDRILSKAVKPSTRPPLSLQNSLDYNKKRICRCNSLENLSDMRKKVIMKTKKFTATSFDDIRGVLSGDTLSASISSGSFDFDDIFVKYADDECRKLSFVTKTIGEATTKTVLEDCKINKTQNKQTVSSEYSKSISTLNPSNSPISVYSELSADSSLPPRLESMLPDVHHQLPRWYKDGLITESDSGSPLSVKDSCSSCYMNTNQTSNTSNWVNDEELSTTTVEKDGFTHHTLLLSDGCNSSSLKCSETVSNMSFSSSEFPYTYQLILQERIKISDKPIRCLLQTTCEGEAAIISCAGCCGDDEAVLKWTKEGKEKLWTNDPIIEVCPYTNTIKPSQYARSRMPRRSSLNTSTLMVLSNTTEMESFLASGRVGWCSMSSSASSTSSVMSSSFAKVQNIFSRVQENS